MTIDIARLEDQLLQMSAEGTPGRKFCEAISELARTRRFPQLREILPIIFYDELHTPTRTTQQPLALDGALLPMRCGRALCNTRGKGSPPLPGCNKLAAIRLPGMAGDSTSPRRRLPAKRPPGTTIALAEVSSRHSNKARLLYCFFHVIFRGCRSTEFHGPRALHEQRPAPAQILARRDSHPALRAWQSATPVSFRPHCRNQRQGLHCRDACLNPESLWSPHGTLHLAASGSRQ